MQNQNPLLGNRDTNRISLFVDGENAYYAQRSLGWFSILENCSIFSRMAA